MLVTLLRPIKRCRGSVNPQHAISGLFLVVHTKTPCLFQGFLVAVRSDGRCGSTHSPPPWCLVPSLPHSPTSEQEPKTPRRPMRSSLQRISSRALRRHAAPMVARARSTAAASLAASWDRPFPSILVSGACLRLLSPELLTVLIMSLDFGQGDLCARIVRGGAGQLPKARHASGEGAGRAAAREENGHCGSFLHGP